MATFSDIATAAKAAIDSIGLAGQTVIKKDGTLQPRDFERYGLPLTLIWLKQDLGESWATTGQPSANDYGTLGRDVVIGIDRYWEVQGDLTSNLADAPNDFQAIKKVLNKPKLAGAGTVWNTRLGTNALWERTAFAVGGQMSHCDLTFMGVESRNL